MARVLVVDDDNDWGELARRWLDRAGFDVQFHRGSLGALNLIRDGNFELLLLDVKMPGLDGARIAHTLYHVRSVVRPKLVFCSAIDTTDLRNLAQQLKADGCFSKSASIDDLLRLVRHLLEPPAGEPSSRGVASEAAGDVRAACPVCGLAQFSGE